MSSYEDETGIKLIIIIIIIINCHDLTMSESPSDVEIISCYCIQI